MKKILIVFSIIFILFLTSCEEVSYFFDIPNITEGLLPEEISRDYVLPKEYNDLKMKYYLEDIELKDYILKVPYSLTNTQIDLKIVVSAQFNKKTFIKKITLNKSDAVSTLYINTNYNLNLITKDKYMKGEISIAGTNNFDVTYLDMEIKGRGNSTWHTYPKKPYKIKLDQKQSLLGMASGRDYVLLAEFGDKSLLRNYMAHKMGELIGLSYNLDVRFINLYINNSYQGLYLLTEEIEFGKDRINLGDDINSDDFMLELEDQSRITSDLRNNIDYIYVQNRYFNISEPNLNDFNSSVQITKSNYIKNELSKVLTSLNSSMFENYINVDEFIKFFIVQEITKNVDINFSSVFLYKQKDEKMMIGPLWDFDISMGNGDYYPYQAQGDWASNNFILEKLLKNNDFKNKYIKEMRNFIIDYKDLIIEELNSIKELIKVDANKNFGKWIIFDTYYWPNTEPMMKAKSFESQVDYLELWLTQRFNWVFNNIQNI